MVIGYCSVDRNTTCTNKQLKKRLDVCILRMAPCVRRRNSVGLGEISVEQHNPMAGKRCGRTDGYGRPDDISRGALRWVSYPSG